MTDTVERLETVDRKLSEARLALRLALQEVRALAACRDENGRLRAALAEVHGAARRLTSAVLGECSDDEAARVWARWYAALDLAEAVLGIRPPRALAGQISRDGGGPAAGPREAPAGQGDTSPARRIVPTADDAAATLTDEDDHG